jgi:tetratricopeptide (TPR) repeat protein
MKRTSVPNMFTRQKIFVSLLSLWLPVAAMAKPKEKPPEHKAQPPEQDAKMAQAKELFAQGEDFFKLGQFDKAIEKYQESYLLSKAPLLLLNIGQCYYHLDQPEEAKHSYEAFIREDPSNPYSAEAEDKIKEMQALIDKQALASSASLPLVMGTPIQEPNKRKPWLWIGAGGALLGGAVLTIVLLSNNNANPNADLGGQFVDF